MQFKYGTKVFTSDGKRVGTLDRIVIDPNTQELTHLIVQKGFLFTQDKVIPMGMVSKATEDEVTLRKNGDELEEFPDFIESQFVSAGGDNIPPDSPASKQRVHTIFWYPPIKRMSGAGYLIDPGPVSQFKLVETINIPKETVALVEGADVISSDGEHVGDIEKVFLDPEQNTVTHFLISAGLFLKEKKLIPTLWLTKVLNDEVHLSVDSKLINRLPEYQI